MKRLIFFLCLLAPSVSHGVVAIEGSIRAADNSSAVTSTSSPVNVGAANDLLIVFVGGFDTTYTNTVINGVTYNAVGLTRLQSQDNPTTTRRLGTFYMINPPTGALTLTTTWAGATLGGHVHAVILTGTPSVAPIDASSGTTSASATLFSISTATSNNGAMSISFCSASANALTKQGSRQTQLQRSSNNFWWSSTTPPSASGSQTHVYSNGTTDTGDCVIVSVDSTSSPPFVMNKSFKMERLQ